MIIAPANTSRLWSIYKSMIKRCYQKSRRDYRSYGAKGITVCDERKHAKLITAFGESKYIREWENDKRMAVSKTILRDRLHRGWSPEEALTKVKESIKNNCNSLSNLFK